MPVSGPMIKGPQNEVDRRVEIQNGLYRPLRSRCHRMLVALFFLGDALMPVHDGRIPLHLLMRICGSSLSDTDLRLLHCALAFHLLKDVMKCSVSQESVLIGETR